ncbi:hypothetical protein ACLB2K_028327 [Fragaria x ananassa]
MRFLLHRPLHKLSALSSSTSLLMASKQLLKSTPFTNPSPPSSQTHLFHSHRLVFSAFPPKPTSKGRPFCLRTNGYSYASRATVKAPKPVDLEITDEQRCESLTKKLKEIGIDDEICEPAQYGHLICPMCKGGDSEEKSLSIFIEKDWSYATWQCHRRKCDWKGRTMAFAGSKSSYKKSKNSTTDKTKREITVESLGLEPLCEEVLAFFSERGISRETVVRNKVMQKRCSITDQISIAFTYWRNGKLISCKYRDINKKFWQEEDTEWIFYGLDDIKDTNDIIIVEGEMDKLAMEEAGYRNCVSVPDGAPPKASPPDKDVPPEEQKSSEADVRTRLKVRTSLHSPPDGSDDGAPPPERTPEESPTTLPSRQQEKVIGDASRVRSGGGAPLSTPDGGEQGDVCTFSTVRRRRVSTREDARGVPDHFLLPAIYIQSGSEADVCTPLKCGRPPVLHRPATTAPLHLSGCQRCPRSLSFAGEIDLKVWAAISTQNFRQSLSWLQTGIRRTRRQEKVIGDASGVRSGGGVPSSAPDGGERRDVRTLRAVRMSALDPAYIHTHTHIGRIRGARPHRP